MKQINGCLVGINVHLPAHFPPYTPGDDYEQLPAECCASLVWVGPKQCATKRQHPEVPLYCALCVSMASKQHGITPQVMFMEDINSN